MVDFFLKLTVQEAWMRKDAQTLKAFKTLKCFLLGKTGKTTTLIKLKPCSHVLSCSTMFKDLYGEVFARIKGSRSMHNYH